MFGASGKGVFLSRLIGDDLVLELITTRVFELLAFFKLCASSTMQNSVFVVVKSVVTYDYLNAINFTL
jgi:hypothetical protein